MHRVSTFARKVLCYLVDLDFSFLFTAHIHYLETSGNEKVEDLDSSTWKIQNIRVTESENCGRSLGHGGVKKFVRKFKVKLDS